MYSSDLRGLFFINSFTFSLELFFLISGSNFYLFFNFFIREFFLFFFCFVFFVFCVCVRSLI